MDALPLEMWGEISNHVSCGSDWKAWIFTCREFAKHNTDAQVVRFANFNDTILKLYWDKIKGDIDLETLDTIDVYTKLRNRGIYLKTTNDITWDIIISNPDITWDFENMGNLPCITIERIKSIPDVDWDTRLISINPNITWEIYNDNKELFDWNWYQMNPQINWDIIIRNPEHEWNYRILSNNPNITWDIVRNNLRLGWDFRYLTYNPKFTWKIIRENLDFVWDPIIISSKPDLSIDEILTLDHNFVPEENPNVTMNIVNANPNRKWNYDLLAQNPSIKFEHMRDNPLIEPFYVSLNPSITVKDVMNNPDYPWDYITLLRLGTIINAIM